MSDDDVRPGAGPGRGRRTLWVALAIAPVLAAGFWLVGPGGAWDAVLPASDDDGSGGGTREVAQQAGAPAADAPDLRNELASSTSPYLRSAAHQPVHWQQWGEEVFALARRTDMPIYLDIGAIWCHWCHVMDRESYENPEIAALINRHFIPVKVDRDRRPDIDQRYQRAVGSLSGQSGWPLTAFLTPAGEVFYGGTYYPPDILSDIVPQVAAAYHERRDEVTATTRSLQQHLEESVFATSRGDVSRQLVEAVVADARQRFDPEWGGFGDAPKFPQTNAVTLVIRRYVETRDPELLEIVETTLDKMAVGGVRDQLSGRFHRYSTDRRWRVPHFEVMLYDQAGILSNYLDAYALTGKGLYREVAEGIIGFLDRSFTYAEGGFYANQDADVSLDDDGSYYTWSVEQLEAAVSAEEAEVPRLRYDVAPTGEMADVPKAEDPGQNVLWVAASVEEIAAETGRPVQEVERLLVSGREAMLKARERRQAPQIDRNVYSDWNGMMVSSYLKAYAVLGDEEIREFALQTLEFLLENSFDPEAGMYHSFFEEERHVPGLLEDQVLVARALLDAYEVTGEARYLERAREITDWTLGHLWDEEDGGFFDSEPDPDALGLLATPRKPVQDAPSASGNGVAAQVLARLHYLTQEDLYRERARQTLETFAGDVPRYGTFAAALGIAAEEHLEPPTTVVVVGELDDDTAGSLHRAALGAFRPGKIVMRVDPHDVDPGRLPAPVVPILEGVEPERWPLAFVCSGTVCAPPTQDPGEVRSLTERFGLTDGAVSGRSGPGRREPVVKP